jgi:hypothetical protein
MRTSKTNLVVALVVLIGGLSCTPEPIVVPVRNLERPADIGFVCLERADVVEGAPEVLTGRPMSVCHDPDGTRIENGQEVPDPSMARQGRMFDDRNGRERGTFGLITNTARGEIAVVDFYTNRLVDLDPSAPGFNHLPVGALPEVVATSPNSCLAVTANRGSCDLSVIDVPKLLARQFPVPAATAASTTVTNLKVKSGGRELLAAPGEVAFFPTPLKAGVERDAMAQAICAVGAPSELVVTFPQCGLVALVALPSGEITSSYKVASDGSVEFTGANPTCPAECGGGADAAAADGALPPLPVDAAPSDAGVDGGDGGLDGGEVEVGPPAPPATPVSRSQGVLGGLAVMPDASRVFVGLADAPFVVSLAVASTDPSNPAAPRRLAPAATGAAIPLAEGALGVTRLRLSIDPFGPPGMDGGFVGKEGKFLYAFARDGSVRVIDVVNFLECDANVEIEPGIVRACYPVRDKPRRRLLAQGPGIRVPALIQPDVPPPVPIDIAFAQVGYLATGFLLASNNQVLHVALGASEFSYGSTTTVPGDTTPLHTFRPAPADFAGGRQGGPPVILSDPNATRNFSASDVPFATKIAFGSDGPRLERFQFGVTTNNMSLPPTWAYFPRPEFVPPQEVNIEWQGVLPTAARISGVLKATSGAAGQAGALNDVGANYCQAGVQVGDIVSLTGCEQDPDCDPFRDEVCYHATPGAPGVCIARSFAMDEERVRACRSEFGSRRRYEVKEARARRLVLGLKVDEVPRPRIAPCQLNPDGTARLDPVCAPDSGHQADPRVPGDRPFSCQPLASGPRCVKTCGELVNGVLTPNDAFCRPGHVCANIGEDAVGPVCVEAPPIKPECLTGELRYRVHVGNAWRIQSQTLPDFATQQEAPTDPQTEPAGEPGEPPPGGLCVPVPNLERRLVNRIPLDAGACTNMPVVEQGLGTFISRNSPAPSNPCLYQGTNTDEAGPTLHWKAFVENPDMRFVLTNFETYVGDAASIRVSVTGGFAPLRVLTTRTGADPALGARIATGPMVSQQLSGTSGDLPVPPYLFVVDQGRALSDLSRGQLLRINPRPWPGAGYAGGFFDSSLTDSLYPIQ